MLDAGIRYEGINRHTKETPPEVCGLAFLSHTLLYKTVGFLHSKTTRLGRMSLPERQIASKQGHGVDSRSTKLYSKNTNA